MGKFALQMMGAVDELERTTIVDNVKMGMTQRAKKGEHNGKLPPGYRVVPAPYNLTKKRSKAVAVVPEEAIIVRKIFELYTTGRGLKSVANEFADSYSPPLLIFYIYKSNNISYSLRVIYTNYRRNLFVRLKWVRNFFLTKM